MTVSTQNNRIDYVGNGVTKTFDFDFLVFESGHLTIYFGDELQTSGWTAYDLGVDDGGYITFDVAPASGVEISIIREVPFTQPIDYDAYGPFPTETHERGLDLGVMRSQQLAEIASRAITQTVGRDYVDFRGLKATNLASSGRDDKTAATNVQDVEDIVEETLRAVAVSGGSIISENPPTIKVHGQRWTRCTDMLSFIWNEDTVGDPSTGGWIEDNPSMGDARTSDKWRRETTVEEIATGSFSVGDRLSLVDRGGARFSVSGGELFNGYDVLYAGQGLVARYESTGCVPIEHMGASPTQTSSFNSAAISAAIAVATTYGMITCNSDALEHSGFSLSCSLSGNGRLVYTGNGNGITCSSDVEISGVTIDSAGFDYSNILVTSSVGVTITNGATVQNGLYNVVVNGVSNGLSIGGGAKIKNAREDNVFCIQGKRFTISEDAFISGAGGWAVNCDSTTAVSPDQQHGFIIKPQAWGNKKGAIRIVGTTTNYVQHPIIGGHLDHNQDDVVTSTPSYGIYLDYVTRPIICPSLNRTHRTRGMYLGNVSFPVVNGNIFWKNAVSYELTANCTRALILGVRYDSSEAPIIANIADHTIVSDDIRAYGTVTAGSGILATGTDGRVRQYLTGNGAGNMDIDVNKDVSNRTLTLKNGSRTDLNVVIKGVLGISSTSTATTLGTVVRKLPIKDDAGTIIGYVPLYNAIA